MMSRFLQSFSLVSGILALIVTIGFLFEIPFFLQLFPWTLSRLSSIFIASIFAAIATPVILIGLRGEVASSFGGAVNLGLMFAGWAILCFQLYLGDNSRQAILNFGIFSAILVVFLAFVAQQSWGMPLKDTRPTPALVRYSFAFFALALFLAGVALIHRAPNVFPWDISEELRILYGWIFLGAMCYFIYGFFVAKWGNAQGQLLGFLAYDLVLIVPFVQHFATVIPEQRLSLIIYVGVLVYSGLLAIYFLFINKETRLGSVAQA